MTLRNVALGLIIGLGIVLLARFDHSREYVERVHAFFEKYLPTDVERVNG